MDRKIKVMNCEELAEHFIRQPFGTVVYFAACEADKMYGDYNDWFGIKSIEDKDLDCNYALISYCGGGYMETTTLSSNSDCSYDEIDIWSIQKLIQNFYYDYQQFFENETFYVEIKS